MAFVGVALRAALVAVVVTVRVGQRQHRVTERGLGGQHNLGGDVLLGALRRRGLAQQPVGGQNLVNGTQFGHGILLRRVTP